MSNRNIITFEVEGIVGSFNVYEEPTILEAQQIENKAIELAGGIENYLAYKAKLTEFEGYVKRQGDTLELLYNLSLYTDSQGRLGTIYQLATLMILMKSSPVNLNDLLENDFNKIYSAYEVALKCFQKAQPLAA